MFIKRLFTAAISFVLLLSFFYVGGSFLVGFVVGADSAMEEQSKAAPPDVEKIREEAKKKARADVEGHLRIITLTAVVLSALSSFVLAFGGLLPWCRKLPLTAVANDLT